MDLLAERTRQVGRRHFLCWSLTTTAVAMVAHSPVAGAATDCATTEVFMLDADWGYPRGPHAKTRLVSRASREAAANRVALTEADADAMNLHLCSFAPPRAVTVRRSELLTLWATFSYTWHNPWADRDVTILDLRHVLADPTGARLWAEATASCPSIPAPGKLTPPRPARRRRRHSLTDR